ncbi:transposase, partial [bacterium]|nr:transposase [bacterium]
KLSTSNHIERINRELRRRTDVVSIFPNEASVARLVGALLIEMDEEWLTGKKYVTFTN